MCLAGIGVAQTPSSQDRDGTGRADQSAQQTTRTGTSAKHDVGSGAGDVGKGVAKGAGSAAAGTGKAAGDLVTLHPVSAATDLGRGAAGTDKNVGVGTVKGTGKMLRGAGKAIKHLF
jgi:hypothetical protein